jgi:putative endonuclease
MTADLRHRLGQQGEALAAEHLARLGYTILERNYRTRWGELDIVAFDGTTLAFCEVKTRRLSRAGGPLEGLRHAQRQRLRKMAGAWMIERKDRPYSELIRFDAIGVTIDATGKLVSLEHLEGAF